MHAFKKATLIKSQKISADIKSLTFLLEKKAKHLPGQFYIIKIPTSDKSTQEREYSLSSPSSKEGIVEFGIQLVENGSVSPKLHTLKKGEIVEMKGPIGKYFNWYSKLNKNLVFI